MGREMGAAPYRSEASPDRIDFSPHEELRGAVDLLHGTGGVERLDRDMLRGLSDLRDLTVSDVMIHRTEMVKSAPMIHPNRW